MTLFSWHFLLWEEALAAVRSLGISQVDIGIFPDRYHLRTGELMRNPLEYAKRAGAALERHALQVADIFFHPGETARDLAPNHPEPDRIREADRRLDAVLAFATELKSPHLTTLPGVPFHPDSPTQDLDQSAATLRRWADQARDHGITPGIEPHIGSVADTPAKAISLLDAVPGLGMTLDPAHFVCEGMDFDSIRLLAPRATHAHLRPARAGKLQCALEESTIPPDTFLALLSPERCPSAAIELVQERPLCDEVDILQTTRRMLIQLKEKSP